MPQPTSEREKGGYESIRDACVVHREISVLVDGDHSLVWLHRTQVVADHVMGKIILPRVSMRFLKLCGMTIELTMTSMARKKHGDGSGLFHLKILW